MGGYVAAGGVFAYLQGLGMTLGAAVPTLPAALALPAAAPALPAVAAGGVVVAGLAALLL